MTNRDVLSRRAHEAINAAVRRGEIAKPDICSECRLVPEFGRIEAHHPDHSEPLVVDWLCSRCHGKRKLEAFLSSAIEPAMWSAIVRKAKREGISLRALILGWLKDWVSVPQTEPQ